MPVRSQTALMRTYPHIVNNKGLQINLQSLIIYIFYRILSVRLLNSEILFRIVLTRFGIFILELFLIE